MPDPYERHARPGKHAYYGEEPKGTRSQARAAAAGEPAKRPPGKKDPDLCKAQHWKAGHTPALRVRIPYFRKDKGKVSCYWGLPYWGSPGEDAVWYCSHEEYCSGCGKILQIRISAPRCPRYHDITKTERASVEKQRDEREIRMASWRRRPRKIIDGPQGYRKRKK